MLSYPLYQVHQSGAWRDVPSQLSPHHGNKKSLDSSSDGNCPGRRGNVMANSHHQPEKPLRLGFLLLSSRSTHKARTPAPRNMDSTVT